MSQWAKWYNSKRWRMRRLRQIQQHPLCAMCLEDHRITAARVADHVIPHRGNAELFWYGPLQSLCEHHHNSHKRQIEITGYVNDVGLDGWPTDPNHPANSNSQAATAHPDWLTPSAIPLTIVCGPPCSGKTTYIKDHATDGDIIIDLDTIVKRIMPNYTHWRGMMTKGLLNAGIRIRNSMLDGLSTATQRKAWFIVSAPTHSEREWWKHKLGGVVIVLDTSIDECKRRAVARDTPLAIAGIDDWIAKATRPWVQRHHMQR